MWTDDQQKAIQAPVSDILVTAAAGSGKTAVMVERLVERIIAPDGVDIDRVLVVTFTKAAAAEIKERIASKISQKLDEGENTRLKNQLALLPRASICTIHSFCLDILRSNFHLLNLAPNFKVADTAETESLKASALDDVLDVYFEDEDDDFLQLVNSFTKKSDEPLADIILNLYEFSMSCPEPEKWLGECERTYSGDCEIQLGYLLEKVREQAEESSDIYRRAIMLCTADSAFEKCRGVLGEEKDYADGIARLCGEGWDRVYNFVKEHKFSQLRSNKNMDTAVFEEVKSLRDRARAMLKEIGTDKVNMPLEDVVGDLIYMRPVVMKMCELVREFGARYAQYKRDKNLVDFNDFEHFALQLLTDDDHPEVAENLRNRFEEIYVDEYQDCNGVQEAVFKAVSREGDGNPNIFMVGDMKQCIYRFRNANPMLFKHKSDTYSPDSDSYRKITLSQNFRSRGSVLECANALFSRIMSEGVGELDYTAEQYLYEGAKYDDVNPDTLFADIEIIDATDDEDDEADEKPARIEAEANLVAKKIHDMVKSGDYIVYDKKADDYRPIKYMDIAILLRNAGNNAEYFADALSSLGIPSFSDAGGGCFDCEEVETLIDFIKIISNPVNDISLAAVMRSVIYNFTDAELLKIRNADRTRSFYSAVKKTAEGRDALSAKVRAFMEQLSDYRKKSSVVGVDELLWHIIDNTGYMDYVGTLPGGVLKKANVRMLINKAGIFTQKGGDFNSFPKYFEQMRTYSGGEGAKLIGENDDVVRIMTVHKSKGLEFPVVILGNCGKRFNMRDVSAPVIMHHEMGIGINYVDVQKRFSYVPSAKRAVAEKIMSENISEEMRLLYVAFTRAREKLIITGVVNDYDKFRKKLSVLSDDEGKLSPRATADCRSFLEWIMGALLPYESGGKVTADNGHFKINVTPICALATAEENVERKEEIGFSGAQSPYNSEIRRRLNYDYPYSHLKNLPRNVTVTEIKRIYELEDDNVFRIYRMPKLKKPPFAEEAGKPDSAEIGTLMHRCMEKIKLTEYNERGKIEEELKALADERLIPAENLSYVNIDAIFSFFNSEVGKSMVRAKTVCREIPFEILSEADEIFPNAGTNEKIVVQGMIDAYFIDDGGNLILVDYKTDSRKGMDISLFKEKIIRRYGVQIRYYEKALERITGRSVSKKYIYLFDIGEAVEV